MRRSILLSLVVAIATITSGASAHQLAMMGVGRSVNAATFTLIDHRTDGLGQDGGPSGNFNSVNSTLAVIAVGHYEANPVAAGDISSSPSWTWTECGSGYGGSGVCRLKMFSALITSTSATSTVTVTKSNSFASIVIATFSGGGVSPCDDEDGAATFGTSITPAGAITPSQNNALVISAVATGADTTLTEPAGYALLDYTHALAGPYYGTAMAYKVQGTAASTQPSWSSSASVSLATIAASFIH